MSDQKDHFNSPEENPLEQLAEAPSAEAVARIKENVQRANDKKK